MDNLDNLEKMIALGEQFDRMLIDEMKSDKYGDEQKQLLLFASCSTAEAIELVYEVIGNGSKNEDKV